MHDPIGDDPKHGLKIGGLSRSSPAESAPEIDEAGATTAAGAAAPSGEITSIEGAEVSPTTAIADALAAGAIDAATAERQLIDAIVASQLPAGASSEAVAALQAEVSALLAGNPLLRSLLRPA